MLVIIAGTRPPKDILRDQHALLQWYWRNGTLAYRSIESSGFDITGVIEGEAEGYDKLGRFWAVGRNVPCTRCYADWNPNGVFDKAAGIKRNIEMSKIGEGLVAFWDGESRGTKNMIDTMERLDKPVVKIMVKP